jgi:hypothetical protein
MIRIAIIVAAVFAVLASYGVTYRAGVNSARGECNAAAIQAQLDAARIDLEGARRAAAEEAKQSNELRASAEQTEGKLNELETDLRNEKAKADAALAGPASDQPSSEPAPSGARCPPQPRGRAPVDRGGASSDDLRRLRTFGPD